MTEIVIPSSSDARYVLSSPYILLARRPLNDHSELLKLDLRMQPFLIAHLSSCTNVRIDGERAIGARFLYRRKSNFAEVYFYKAMFYLDI